MQMIGVGQFDLTSERFQVKRINRALDRAGRSDILEHRCLHNAVGGAKFPSSGVSLCFEQIKSSYFHNSLVTFQAVGLFYHKPPAVSMLHRQIIRFSSLKWLLCRLKRGALTKFYQNCIL